MKSHKSRLGAVFGVALCIGLLGAESADARRSGGGFGSRGARTYQAPPPTRTAPQQAAPIQRSMTPGQPAGQPPGAAPQATRPGTPAATPATAAQPPRRGGFLGGLGGGLLGGLLLGGLVGALMGHGFGAGMAGLGAALFQGLILAGLVFLALKLFRRRQQPAMAGAAGWSEPRREASLRETMTAEGFGRPQMNRVDVPPAAPVAAPAAEAVEIGVTGQDRETFERLLMEIQDGLGREDYGALRERSTPEIMSFLAEELGQNATEGRRNEISGTRLLEADIAEAWQEGDREYATAAMRYEAFDVVRDRKTGAVLEGDPDQLLQTTELWTFVRQGGGAWKLSAIQPA